VNDFIDAVDVAYQLSAILNDPEPVQHTGSSFTTLQTCTPILLFTRQLCFDKLGGLCYF